MAKMNRLVFRVFYLKKLKVWGIECRELDGSKSKIGERSLKRHAIEDAVADARYEYEQGVLSQVVVHNKDGRIAFERTYGKDPKRRKG